MPSRTRGELNANAKRLPKKRQVAGRDTGSFEKSLFKGGEHEKRQHISIHQGAFNLGVWIRKNAPADNIFEAGMCLRETIFYNIDKPEETAVAGSPNANVDYLLEVALLGYVMSGICTYDEA